MLVVIIGPSCAGKTTAGEYIESETGCRLHEASDYVHRRFDRSSRSRDVMTFVTRAFESGRKDFVARSLLDDVSPSPSGELHVVAGLRTAEELDLLVDHFEESYVLGVQADASTRYERYLERNREARTLEYEQFLQKDAREYAFGIAKMLATRTDGFVVNDGRFDALYDDLGEELACIRESIEDG